MKKETNIVVPDTDTLSFKHAQTAYANLYERIDDARPTANVKTLTLFNDILHFEKEGIGRKKMAKKLLLRFTPVYETLLNHEARMDLGTTVYHSDPQRVDAYKRMLSMHHLTTMSRL